MVAGSITNEVFGFYPNLLNPSSRNMALGFIQPLTEISNILDFLISQNTRVSLKAKMRTMSDVTSAEAVR
jgi:hypothetical protein